MINVIQSHSITKNTSVNVYGFNSNNDILAGLNQEKPRKYKVYRDDSGNYFNFRGIKIYLYNTLMAV